VLEGLQLRLSITLRMIFVASWIFRQMATASIASHELWPHRKGFHLVFPLAMKLF
jgi:hypothetical protein